MKKKILFFVGRGVGGGAFGFRTISNCGPVPNAIL